MAPVLDERVLMSHIGDVVVAVDENGRVAYVSPSVERLGYSQEALVGRAAVELVHDGDLARASEAIRENLSGKLTARSREFRVIAADGQVVWMEGNPTICFDERGEAVGYVTVMRDVTGRRAWGEDAARLGQAASRLDHEIRTPLHGLLGNLDLLATRSLDAEDRRLVDDMARSAQALSHLLLGFLAQPSVASADDEPAAPPAAAGDPRLRVLAVDDHPINLRLIEAILSDRADVTFAADGAAAVAAASAQAFDLVLMDVQMPVMDGLQAVRIIRSGGGPNAQTPIVMLTANGAPSDVAASRAAGADRHVLKPISPERLAAVVREMGTPPIEAPSRRSSGREG